VNSSDEIVEVPFPDEWTRSVNLSGWLDIWEAFAREIGADWTDLPKEIEETCRSARPSDRCIVYLGKRLRHGGFGSVWVGDWLVKLEPYLDPNGRRRARIEAAFVNGPRIRFSLRRVTGWERFSRAVGFDVEIVRTEDAEFDRTFCLRASHPRLVRRLLADQDLRAVICACRDVTLAIGADPWVAGCLPTGVDPVALEAPAPDLAGLRGAYSIFLRVIDALDAGLTRPENAFERAREALAAPDGRTDHDAGLLLWDGALRRERAIRKLGLERDPRSTGLLLHALTDPAPGVRGAAASTLAELGRASIGPQLIPLLGDFSLSRGGVVSAQAAEALGQLGLGRVSSAFLAALRGDLSHCGDLEAHRRHVIAAARCALQTGGNRRRLGAAQLLAHWGVAEAMAEIRSLRAEMRRSGGRLAEALDAIIADLDSRRTLPRPARAPSPSPAQLPFPAVSPAPDPSRLPMTDGR
jgi:hypothetical protein